MQFAGRINAFSLFSYKTFHIHPKPVAENNGTHICQMNSYIVLIFKIFYLYEHENVVVKRVSEL